MTALNPTAQTAPARSSDGQTAPLALVRHPAAPCPGALALQVRVARPSAGRLQLEYRLAGDWRTVTLPKHNNTPEPEPELWRHTCFEAFLGTPGSRAYHEFNFSPSGDWAVFAFSSWRQRMADCSHALQPTVSFRSTPAELCMRVDTPLPPAVGGSQAGAPLGLSAVIAHADGRRCYWALAHPCDDPDFHARTGWLATLPPAPLDRT